MRLVEKMWEESLWEICISLSSQLCLYWALMHVSEQLRGLIAYRRPRLGSDRLAWWSVSLRDVCMWVWLYVFAEGWGDAG